MEDRLNKAEESITELKESSARREEQLKVIDNKLDRLFKKNDEIIKKIDEANDVQNKRIAGLEDFKSKVVFAGKSVIWTIGLLAGAATFAVKVVPGLIAIFD